MDDFIADLCQPLFQFLLRMTRDHELAADLTQEALLRAWKKRHSLREARALRVWVFRIGANLFKDHLRSATNEATSGTDLDCRPGREPSPVACASHAETLGRVAAAMDELPERQRQVMYLRTIEQLTPREIAEVLDLDAGTVRSNLSVARKRLRIQLAELEETLRPVNKSSP